MEIRIYSSTLTDDLGYSESLLLAFDSKDQIEYTAGDILLCLHDYFGSNKLVHLLRDSRFSEIECTFILGKEGAIDTLKDFLAMPGYASAEPYTIVIPKNYYPKKAIDFIAKNNINIELLDVCSLIRGIRKLISRDLGMEPLSNQYHIECAEELIDWFNKQGIMDKLLNIDILNRNKIMLSILKFKGKKEYYRFITEYGCNDAVTDYIRSCDKRFSDVFGNAKYEDGMSAIMEHFAKEWGESLSSFNEEQIQQLLRKFSEQRINTIIKYADDKVKILLIRQLLSDLPRLREFFNQLVKKSHP